MNDGEFNDLKNSVAGKSFEDTKPPLAKQVPRPVLHRRPGPRPHRRVLLRGQQARPAKYAYDHTYDIGNYYKVSDAFTFESPWRS